MLKGIYTRLSPFITLFFMFTTAVFFGICVWRGEIILGLQSEALKSKDQTVKLIVEQHEVANKVSHEFEIKTSNLEQEKIYVDREVEKIVLVPSYSNECFDLAGLQQVNNRITAFNSSRESEGTMPTNTGDH